MSRRLSVTASYATPQPTEISAKGPDRPAADGLNPAGPKTTLFEPDSREPGSESQGLRLSRLAGRDWRRVAASGDAG